MSITADPSVTRDGAFSSFKENLKSVKLIGRGPVTEAVMQKPAGDFGEDPVLWSASGVTPKTGAKRIEAGLHDCTSVKPRRNAVRCLKSNGQDKVV